MVKLLGVVLILIVAALPAGAQVPAANSWAVNAELIAYREFTRSGTTKTGIQSFTFSVIRFWTKNDADRAFEAITVVLGQEPRPGLKETSAPMIGERSIAFTGRVDSEDVATMVSQYDYLLFYGVASGPESDPLLALLPLIELMQSGDRILAPRIDTRFMETLPVLGDMPVGFTVADEEMLTFREPATTSPIAAPIATPVS